MIVYISPKLLNLKKISARPDISTYTYVSHILNVRKLQITYSRWTNTSEEYSTGPNNSGVLNKRVGGIFFSPFVGENACFWKNFKSCYVKKGMLA